MKFRVACVVSFIALQCFVFGAVGMPSAFASYILGYNEDSNNGEFQIFDFDNKSTTSLSYLGDDFTSGGYDLESLTYGGQDGTYYGIKSSNNKNKPSELYSFSLDGDTVTGAASGTEFDASNIDAAAYLEGVLYAFDNKADDLITIDVEDGSKSSSKNVSGLGNKKIEGLAFSNDGLLYASATKGNKSWLYSIDMDAGQANEIGKIADYGQIEALTFIDETLYGIGSTRGNPLLQIDTATGIISGEPIEWGTGDVEGIASSGSGAAVPEPATIVLIGSGLLCLAGSGARRFFGKRRNPH